MNIVSYRSKKQKQVHRQVRPGELWQGFHHALKKIYLFYKINSLIIICLSASYFYFLYLLLFFVIHIIFLYRILLSYFCTVSSHNFSSVLYVEVNNVHELNRVIRNRTRLLGQKRNASSGTALALGVNLGRRFSPK